MKEKKKILSKYKRSVHVNNKEWTWQLQKGFRNDFLLICTPDRYKKLKFKINSTVYHCQCWEDEMCYFCDTGNNFSQKPITPSLVKRIIEKNSHNKFKDLIEKDIIDIDSI